MLCGIPGSDIPQFDLMHLLSLDKVGHAGVFAVLVWLGCRGLEKQYAAQANRSNAVWLALVFAVLYSPLTEWLQGAVFVDRYADPLDMLANWVGCAIGLYLYSRNKRRRSAPKAGLGS